MKDVLLYKDPKTEQNGETVEGKVWGNSPIVAEGDTLLCYQGANSNM